MSAKSKKINCSKHIRSHNLRKRKGEKKTFNISTVLKTMKFYTIPAVMFAAFSISSTIASPVASPVSESTSNNNDGDCVCYGPVTGDRSLLTHRVIWENSVHRSPVLRPCALSKVKRMVANVLKSVTMTTFVMMMTLLLVKKENEVPGRDPALERKEKEALVKEHLPMMILATTIELPLARREKEVLVREPTLERKVKEVLGRDPALGKGGSGKGTPSNNDICDNNGTSIDKKGKGSSGKGIGSGKKVEKRK
jgi:hypothetical protein